MIPGAKKHEISMFLMIFGVPGPESGQTNEFLKIPDSNPNETFQAFSSRPSSSQCVSTPAMSGPSIQIRDPNTNGSAVVPEAPTDGAPLKNVVGIEDRGFSKNSFV